MNLGQARTQLQALGYGTDTATQQTAFLNDAVRELVSERWWAWNERIATGAVAAGASRLVLATTIRADDVQHVHVQVGSNPEDRYELRRVSADELLDLRDSDSTLRGPPEVWAWDATSVAALADGPGLRFWPLADGAYTFEVAHQIVALALAADGDPLPGPADFHDVFVAHASLSLAYRERDWTAFDRAAVTFDRKRRKMIQNAAGRFEAKDDEIEDVTTTPR